MKERNQTKALLGPIMTSVHASNPERDFGVQIKSRKLLL
jgi:hypothetical protein